jgi:transcriptional regulator with XRE-family HTH domain
MKDERIKPKGPQRSARALLARWIVRGRMTQGEAAEQIGISRVKLNQYLNAEARPSLDTAIRIEDTTGVSIRTWLIADDVTARSPASASGMARSVQDAEGDSEVNITSLDCGKLG